MNIISIVTSMLCFVLCLIFKKNRPLHPTTLFFGMWTFILGLSLLGKYNIIQPSSYAYFLISLMLIFCFLGSSFNVLTRIKIKRKKLRWGSRNGELNIHLYYFFVIVAILFLVYDVYVMLKYLFMGVPLWQIRNWLLEEFGSNNPIMVNRTFLEEVIRNVILYPVGMIMPPITAYVFFSPERKPYRKNIMVLSIIYMILYSVSGGGGRLRYIYFLGCFLISYLTFSSKKFQAVKRKKYGKRIMIISVFAIVAVAVTTRFRIGSGYIFQQIYTYFALPPTLLSIWLPDIENVKHTCGLLTTFGIHSYFFRVLSMVGLDALVPSLYENAYQALLNAQEFRNTGYGIGNAFVSPVYYFYVDGGVPFVCGASLFFGIIINKVYSFFTKNINIRSFSIYALMMYGVFMTFQTIITALPSYIISFVVVYFMCSKKKIE